MASRMMHYIIALEILKKCPAMDAERFIAGSLIPDASSHSDGSYDAAHFSDRAERDGCRVKGINWARFEEKYRVQLDDALFQGYLCHLITDAVWFCRVTDRFVRWRPDKAASYKLGYEDFRRLNFLLMEDHDVSCPALQAAKTGIDEIDETRIDSVFNGLCEDFELAGPCSKNDLVIYPYDAVQEFLKESVEVCVQALDALHRGESTGDPAAYYVKVRD